MEEVFFVANGSSAEGGGKICVGEIVSLEQEQFSGHFRQGVRKTIPEVQACWVSTAFAEIAIGFASDVSLSFRVPTADRTINFGLRSYSSPFRASDNPLR